MRAVLAWHCHAQVLRSKNYETIRIIVLLLSMPPSSQALIIDVNKIKLVAFKAGHTFHTQRGNRIHEIFFIKLENMVSPINTVVLSWTSNEQTKSSMLSEASFLN